MKEQSQYGQIIPLSELSGNKDKIKKLVNSYKIIHEYNSENLDNFFTKCMPPKNENGFFVDKWIKDVTEKLGEMNLKQVKLYGLDIINYMEIYHSPGYDNGKSLIYIGKKLPKSHFNLLGPKIASGIKENPYDSIKVGIDWPENRFSYFAEIFGKEVNKRLDTSILARYYSWDTKKIKMMSKMGITLFEFDKDIYKILESNLKFDKLDFSQIIGSRTYKIYQHISGPGYTGYETEFILTIRDKNHKGEIRTPVRDIFDKDGTIKKGFDLEINLSCGETEYQCKKKRINDFLE
ncbi:MAG: hypothetical protein PHQ66_02235 [Candidatus Nanoarchaeia archaeon]|nr:hypothetical protein [Candidatus Nanoarchaeia archaeon]MDD5357811.1 hypothetical protein [Candidatus Nanoarchaeia archaeon]MDD5588730.1 hypothetical protein [Candidatus Nanoarchaeia archaeon]